jgi:hypothetical protein
MQRPTYERLRKLFLFVAHAPVEGTTLSIGGEGSVGEEGGGAEERCDAG